MSSVLYAVVTAFCRLIIDITHLLDADKSSALARAQQHSIASIVAASMPGTRALQVSGANLVGGNEPIADIWACMGQASDSGHAPVLSYVCLNVLSAMVATAAGGLDTIYLAMPPVAWMSHVQVTLCALRPQHVMAEAVFDICID